MAKEVLNIIQSFKVISINEYVHDLAVIIKDDTLNPLEKDLRILSMLSGKDVNFFNQLELDTVKNLFKQIEWVYKSPNSSVQDYYTLMNGRKVKFSKDLKLAFGQTIDILQWQKDNKDEESRLKNIGDFLTCVLIPVKKNRFGKEKLEKYLETDQKTLSEEFMEYMSIEDALGISLFFFLQSSILSAIGKSFLEEESRMKFQQLLKKLKQEKKMPMKKILELEQKINILFSTNGNGSIS